jgi:hypothetical protein
MMSNVRAELSCGADVQRLKTSRQREEALGEDPKEHEQVEMLEQEEQLLACLIPLKSGAG